MSKVSHKDYRVAQRYAVALYDNAESSKSTKTLAGDVRSMIELIEGSADLQSVLKAPIFTDGQKDQVLQKIAKKAKYTSEFSNFLSVMALNNRLDMLLPCLIVFEEIVRDAQGVTQAQVITARALTAKDQKDMQASLKKQMGQDVDIEAIVDENILGGVILKMGSRMIDDSIRTRLQKLERSLEQAGANELTTTQTLKEVG